MPPAPTRVFISYSHDSPEHMNRVLELSDRLRKEGVDCQIDQYEEAPPEGWPRWCSHQVQESEFVLVLCTDIYERRFEGKEEPGRGKGVTFEGFIITQELYDAQGKNEKFIPIVFAAASRQHIPTLLRGATNYDTSTPEGYQGLYRRLTKQPLVKKPEVGKVEAMPTRASLEEKSRKQEFIVSVWSVPIAPTPFFTESGNTLAKLQEKLGPSKCVALSGMPGVGKTQAAAEYAYRHRKDYQAVLWARAETRDTLVADFSSIARLLRLPQSDEKDQSVIVAAVKSWLETNDGWLFILDNANDLAVVREFVPLTHSGQLILTTNQAALGPLAEKVLLEEMNADEAALLLLRRACVIGKQAQLKEASQADRRLAHALAEKLGGLPLALDQAGAFIEEMTSTLAEYTEFYDKEGKRLRDLRGGLSSEHASVTVTFSLAFQELAKRDPLAVDLVRLCAFLAPDAIPEEIFTKGASALSPEFARRAENSLDFANTVKQTATFSLIRRDAPDRSLDIHRLVQDVLKDEMDLDQLRLWAERAVRAVNLAFPEVDFRTWPECERLLPHAKICAALMQQFSLEFVEAARLLSQTAFYMSERAQYADAEPLYQRALVIDEKALGPDDPGLATSLNNLAALYYDQGRYAKAEPLFRRSLAIREKALGADHPYVATGLNNLAELYKAQGRYPEAEPLYKRAITIHEKVLGPDDPGLATDLDNLAELYREQGRYPEAEPLYKRAIAIDEKVLGSDHPGLATDLNNLALLYKAQERYAEAEPLYQRALAIYKKALGPDHPHVAKSLNNLAALYRNQGRDAEAEPLYRRSLAIREKALGPNHPSVATSLNNLALLYNNQGRYAEAEPLYQRALPIWEKALGQEHPNVATTLENYAVLLRNTGREAEAYPLEARAKAIREKMKKQAKP